MKAESDGLYISLHFIAPYRPKYTIKVQFHFISDRQYLGIKFKKVFSLK